MGQDSGHAAFDSVEHLANKRVLIRRIYGREDRDRSVRGAG